MGQNVYLKKEPYELLRAIQADLSDASQGDIIHQALNQFAESVSNSGEADQSDMFFPRITISAIPRVTLDTATGELDAPEEIGEWNLINDEPRKSREMEVKVVYSNGSRYLGLRNEDGEFHVIELDTDSDELLEQDSFDNMAAAVSELNSLLVPLSDTPITPREYQVWWLTEEYSYEKTAELLDVSLETVRTHMTNLAAKRKEAEQTIGLLISQDYPYQRPKYEDTAPN